MSITSSHDTDRLCISFLKLYDRRNVCQTCKDCFRLCTNKNFEPLLDIHQLIICKLCDEAAEYVTMSKSNVVQAIAQYFIEFDPLKKELPVNLFNYSEKLSKLDTTFPDQLFILEYFKRCPMFRKKLLVKIEQFMIRSQEEQPLLSILKETSDMETSNHYEIALAIVLTREVFSGISNVSFDRKTKVAICNAFVDAVETTCHKCVDFYINNHNVLSMIDSYLIHESLNDLLKQIFKLFAQSENKLVSQKYETIIWDLIQMNQVSNVNDNNVNISETDDKVSVIVKDAQVVDDDTNTRSDESTSKSKGKSRTDNIILIQACKYSRMEILTHLIETKRDTIDINVDNGILLYYATINENENILKYLIDSGIDVNADNGEALKEASLSGFINIVRILCENGAICCIDQCIEFARRNKHWNIETYLKIIEKKEQGKQNEKERKKKRKDENDNDSDSGSSSIGNDYNANRYGYGISTRTSSQIVSPWQSSYY